MADAPHVLHRDGFRRSSGYDPLWVMDNNMGPNPLWLLEWLSQVMPLEAGMRVLDLGCGRVLTSVFLARELDLRVSAVDLWTSVDENWQRVVAAHQQDRVTPLHGEAHSLPFAEGYFDAVVSIDAYQYFGTDVMYLYYLSRFLRPGGLLGVVMPGLVRPLPEQGVPPHLLEPQANGRVFWEGECACFQTAAWWADLWQRCSQIELLQSDTLAEGWRLWRDYEVALERAGKNIFPSDAEVLERDAGRYLGFVRLVARRNQATTFNLYDPALEAKVR